MQRISIQSLDFNDDYSYSCGGIPFTGVACEYGPTGELVSEVSFVDGIKDGQTRIWYPGGRLQSESSYRRNALHGVSVEWFENGGQKKRTLHELGILVERDEWDENGNLISRFRLTDGDPNYKMLQKLRLAKWEK